MRVRRVYARVCDVDRRDDDWRMGDGWDSFFYLFGNGVVVCGRTRGYMEVLDKCYMVA